MKVTVFSCAPAVNESERRAIDRVKSGLIGYPGAAEWLLLTNLAFSPSHRLQADEIDMVVIGPPGVRVIEVKHWTATWVRQNRDRVEQEADRVTSKARRIGTTLRKQVADLGHVDGVFLLTEAARKVKAIQGKSVRGVPFYTLKNWRDAIDVDAPGRLSAHQIKTLGRVLEPRSTVAVDGALQRLAGYTHLRLLTRVDERSHRIYRGKHPSRQDQVVLHLYDWSASDDANAETKARREFDALHRLQQFGWVPRIVDSFQEAPGYPGEIAFFTVIDPAAPSIRERSGDDSWDTRARLSFARAAVRALGELHEAGADGEPMVHRNLTPDTVLVRHDNTPILAGFDHARIPADATVASLAPADGGDPATAPEVRAEGMGAADHRSDTYSLCVSLAELFAGREDDTSREIDAALGMGSAEDPSKRCALSDLDASLSRMLGERVPEPPAPPARYWTEDQIVRFRDRDYRIISRLGSGSVGATFKVVEIDADTGEDRGAFVAKVIHDQQTGKRVLRTYGFARSHLHHSALSAIHEVALEWRDNEFAALMTWIEGEPLNEYVGVLPLLAEDLQEVSDEALVGRWLQTMCEALNALHRNGYVHGDISPRNLIVSGTELVLTDYDFVARIGVPVIEPGTVLYSAPSFPESRTAAPSDDIYALAASVFHVMFEQEPFQYNGVLAKERGLNWNDVPRDDYPLLAAFLDRATNPNAEKRFNTATEAADALRPPRTDDATGSVENVDRAAAEAVDQEAESDVVAAEGIGGTGVTVDQSSDDQRSENEVPWLKSLLQSYPGSRWGNRETRGLDTDFASDTYVETNLEQVLYQDIVERRTSLVILCGNAGDGKTALLQHLAERLGLGKRSSATRILEGRLSDGLKVRMNLDGSASWNGRSANQLLDECLAPFQQGRPAKDLAFLLAINDGRLVEWIEDVEEREGETPLTKELAESLVNETPPPESHIRFVNLNQRSLVGGVSADRKSIGTSFLERLVDNLYGGPRAAQIWSSCQTCSARERCEVYRATQLFAPVGVPGQAEQAVRDRARKRLFEMLQAVHLRGEVHTTIRELRAALVYILFGIHYCRDYHENNDGASAQPYWDRAFSPESAERQGEVLRECVHFDPALEAHPQIDRYLLHPSDDGRDIPRYDGLTLEPARRRAWFEWAKEHIESLAGDPCALDLAQGTHLREFRDLVLESNGGEPKNLAKRLCAGISRLETLPPKAMDREDVVPLRITPRTPTETAFWVEKPLGNFRLEADIPNGEDGLDRLHRQAFLIYRYSDGRKERLRLGADLFHLLLELSEGYQLGDVSSDDAFAHLSIFVQRLVRENHRRALAWNPMEEDRIYRISANLADAGSGRQRLTIARLAAGASDAE